MKIIKKLNMLFISALNLFAMSAESESEDKKIPVGGQAVIEGVLMKGKNLWGLAVRRPSGEIFKES